MKKIEIELDGVVAKVRSALDDDIVSLSELKAVMAESLPDTGYSWELAAKIIGCLLTQVVEIGYARNQGGKHVRFIAWKGGADEKIKRAKREMDACSASDRDYAFWLCLSEKVDEYE